MIEEAGKRNVELILVIGRKLPRWPECHAPFWADKLPEPEKQEKILAVMRKEIERYKDTENLYLWQVDNEPFLAIWGMRDNGQRISWTGKWPKCARLTRITRSW